MPEPIVIREVAAANTDTATLSTYLGRGQPLVLRGLVDQWPLVRAARAGTTELTAMLGSLDSHRPASCVVGLPTIGGRFFYTSDMRGMNFGRRNATITELLEQLVAQSADAAPLAIAMQSALVSDVLPRFIDSHPMQLLDAGIIPRIWIGNAIAVATHYDPNDNIACVVAGRRRFTLFPPDQIANLYIGPLEQTPAGAPVSMVDVDAPDLDRHPLFAEAARHAMTAELAPGDAIFIPYMWWHAVRSLDPVSILVNYWWNDAAAGTSPVHAMLHALLAFRDLPPNQRAAWRAVMEHLVFAGGGNAAHLPEDARGVLGTVSPAMRLELHRMIAAGLSSNKGENR